MLKIKKTIGRPTIRIKVTDCDGNIEFFDSPYEASVAIKCSRQSIYNAMSRNKLINGCKVERADESDSGL